MSERTTIPRKGDWVTCLSEGSSGVLGCVHRIARDGTWADVRWHTGDAHWTKRMRTTSLRILHTIPGAKDESGRTPRGGGVGERPMKMRPLQSYTATEILRILSQSVNGQNDMWTIATIIQRENKLFSGMGRYHLAVFKCARALKKRGLVGIHAGEDQHHPEWYYLMNHEALPWGKRDEEAKP